MFMKCISGSELYVLIYCYIVLCFSNDALDVSVKKNLKVQVKTK